MDDILQEFLTECAESLASLDVELVRFEQDPTDADSLASIFRMLHTIKGTSGFLGLPRLGAVAHAGENVLGKFRDGELAVTPEAVTLILRCIDRIRSLLAELETHGAEPEGDDHPLIAELDAMAGGDGRPPIAVAATPFAGPMLSDEGFPVAAEFMAELEAALAASAPPPPEPVAAPIAKEEAAPAKESALAAASIRVNVDVLETLMTQVSELVLTRNQLLQMVRGRDDHEFKVPLQRLSRITSDLQDGVMKTRMQPIGNAWSKLPRIVRDLAVETRKKIDLVMIGAETDLDRQVLELIKDPLTHMVRNSADHGLEGPDARRAAGKDETGRITLKASHEGGHIIILVADDGRGLDVGRIRAKALANKLATAADLDGMTDPQIMQFIFRAGFSTAETVTSVSGRGVGMDVVRTNIEKIGGTVALASQPGRGTTFTIKIPLTLAIVSALVVEAAGQRFAVPQINVVELVRAADNTEARIEVINASPVLRLRDRLLPLVSLRRLLRLDENERLDDDQHYIVVAQVGAHSFGIIVDRVFDTEEIVVKPVAPILRAIPFYSGNTILGDGSVIMILDPNGIAEAAGQVRMASEDRTEARTRRSAQSSDQAFLVFRAGALGLKAVPLGLIARLEEIKLDRVEHANGRRVLQYRDRLVPLIPFDPAHVWRDEGRQPILVFAEGEHTMGLVVDEIIDVVRSQLRIEMTGADDGTIGSAVIGGKAMDVIDVGPYLAEANARWFAEAEPVAAANRPAALVVDRSALFRDLLAPRLTAQGWEVTVASGTAEAAPLAEARSFQLVAIDAALPDAFALARQLRATDESVTLIALLGRPDAALEAQAHAAGFDQLITKNDWQGLLEIVAELAEGQPLDLPRRAA